MCSSFLITTQCTIQQKVDIPLNKGTKETKPSFSLTNTISQPLSLSLSHTHTHTHRHMNPPYTNIQGVSIYMGLIWLLMILQIIMMGFFLFQTWKWYTITTINPQSQYLGQETKNICIITYLETESFKTVQAKVRRKFNFNNYPQKSHIYRWEHKFQARGSVNKPQQEGRKFQMWQEVDC